jgi:hypothetical protein
MLNHHFPETGGSLLQLTEGHGGGIKFTSNYNAN